MDSIITICLLLGLAVMALYQSKYDRDGNPHFFDKDNSNAIRGVVCIIVIIIHIPLEYFNSVQYAVTRFAYIGVTFFFMTSAYGLTLGMRRKPQNIHTFWRNRLPRLLIPQGIVNVVNFLASGILLQKGFGLDVLFRLDTWVGLLLICYLIFWSATLLIKNRYTSLFIVAGVMLLSLLSYTLGKLDLFGAPWWPTELYGFIWGILLYLFFPAIKRSGQNKWPAKISLILVCSFFLGIAYLRYKPVVFWGEYLLRIALGAALIWLVLLVNLRLRIGNAIIGYLGNISYEVYLIHGIVIQLLHRFLPQLSSWSFILLSVLFSIAAAAVVHLVSKPVENWLYAKPYFSGKHNSELNL